MKYIKSFDYYERSSILDELWYKLIDDLSY